MLKKGLFISCILLICSCSVEQEKENPKTKKIELESIVPSYKEASLFETKIDEIDFNKNLIEAKSLSYINLNKSVEQVIAMVDSSMQFSKLTHFVTEENGNQSETSFYFSGNLMFASIKITRRFFENEGYEKEVKCYYNDKGEVLFSAQRKSKLSENLKAVAYSKAEKCVHNPSKALEIINQQGQYATNFQGFNEANGKLYITVGTKTTSSSIVINAYEGILKTLKNNESKFLNKSLKIDFEEINQLDGFSYQALLDIQLLQK